MADTIKIKKSHEGLFTHFAHSHGESVSEAISHVLGDSHASSQRKKQAQFAKNAREWNH